MTPHTLRLPLNASRTALARAELSPEWYRGLPLRVDVAVFSASAMADLEDVSSITMSVRSSREDTTSAALMAKTVASADFTNCTPSQWLAGTHAQVRFDFTAEETNLNLGGAKQSFWVVFKALLNSGEELILGTGIGLCVEANAAAVGDPPENPGPALSVSQADARFLRFDGEQALGTDEQLQALANIGITISADRITFPNGKFIWLNAAS